MKTDIEVLDEAIKLVEGDGKWCQGAYCRNAAGVVTTPDGKSMYGPPVSWCLEGALAQANEYFTSVSADIAEQWRRLKRLVNYQVGGPDDILYWYNDANGTTQQDAVLALKKARAALEGGV